MVREAAGAFASVGARAVELCARELRVEKDDVSEQEERRDEEEQRDDDERLGGEHSTTSVTTTSLESGMCRCLVRG